MVRLPELARVFLRLGATSFGGPAAHIAIMEDELVRRRAWLTREKFLDLIGAVNLIPGPNSTEMAIHIGLLRAGWGGLLVAGISFILPAALMVGALAWAYLRWGSLPQLAGVLYGVKPVVIAVIAQALWSLGRTAVKTRFLAALGLVTAAAAFLGVNELLLLLFAGLVASAARAAQTSLAAVLATPLTAAPAFGLWPLFLFFLKVGAVLFGSGYVLLAFLRADLVERFGWLTETQLLDAVAASQVTPGPLFTVATFIGYILGGWRGAVVATLGIFLPAFLLVAASGRLIPRIRRSPVAGAFLDGVNVASLALMAVVSWQLGRAAVVDWLTAALALVSAALLIRYRLNSVWLILPAAVAGFLARTVLGL